jgi:hypothetical protein
MKLEVLSVLGLRPHHRQDYRIIHSGCFELSHDIRGRVEIFWVNGQARPVPI